MKLYLDTANVEQIKEINDILRLDGVTTTPKIRSKESRDYREVIKEIIEILDDDQLLFMQVLASDHQGMIADAKKILSLRKKNMVPKIPATPEGLKAIKLLSNEGIDTLATAIYSAPQALMAAKNGARYVAPYVSRMDSFTDGVQEVIMLEQTFRNYNMQTEIVAASFRTQEQIRRLIYNGVDSLTLASDFCRKLYEHEGTVSATEEFAEAWRKRFNEDGLNI